MRLYDSDLPAMLLGVECFPMPAGMMSEESPEMDGILIPRAFFDMDPVKARRMFRSGEKGPMVAFLNKAAMCGVERYLTDDEKEKADESERESDHDGQDH